MINFYGILFSASEQLRLDFHTPEPVKHMKASALSWALSRTASKESCPGWQICDYRFKRFWCRIYKILTRPNSKIENACRAANLDRLADQEVIWLDGLIFYGFGENISLVFPWNGWLALQACLHKRTVSYGGFTWHFYIRTFVGYSPCSSHILRLTYVCQPSGKYGKTRKLGWTHSLSAWLVVAELYKSTTYCYVFSIIPHRQLLRTTTNFPCLDQLLLRSTPTHRDTNRHNRFSEQQETLDKLIHRLLLL